MIGSIDFIDIHLDFETYGTVDLTKTGAYVYAAHRDTDILCASFYWKNPDGGGSYGRWRPGQPFPFRDVDPKRLRVLAWNSQFERLIWNYVAVSRYDWPKLELEQFVCVAAQSRAMCAGPSKLEHAAQFFGVKAQKDMRGHRHMLYMCKPAPDAEQLAFMRSLRDGESATERAEAAARCHHTPKNLDILHDYCDKDLDAEMDVGGAMEPWSDYQLAEFWDSERINDEGIVVDVEFARAATEYAEDERLYFAERLYELTGGEVETPKQYAKILGWVKPRVSAEIWDITKWYDHGVEKHSLDADTRANLLSEYSRDPDCMPEEIAELIEVIDMAGKSTIAKYEAIVKRGIAGLVDDNVRVHGLYMFAGAAQSGRYSSVGIQAHNLVRDVPKNAVALIKAFKARDRVAVKREVQAWADAHNAKQKKAVQPKLVKPEPIHALAQLVRPTFSAEPGTDAGFDLVWSDWSQIEAVVLPWLSLAPEAETLELAPFRRGEDMYLRLASTICGRKITKEDEFERQAFGKVPRLSLFYGGGAGAFQAMGKNYGVHLPEREVLEIVNSTREANEWLFGSRVKGKGRQGGFLNDLETAAMRAIRHPHTGFSAGRVEYLYDPDALDGMGCLFALLPSGRAIPYPDPDIQVLPTKWGADKLTLTAAKAAWRPKKGEVEWPRVALWPGLLAENPTQGICACLLRSALTACREAGLRVCGHTHDEIMIYTPSPEQDGPALERIMMQRPGWPGDDMLPLRAEWGAGFRYKVKF